MRLSKSPLAWVKLGVCAGIDEAGRGPLAGPVVAAACVIPHHVTIKGINDSKRMTAAQREEAYTRLMEHPEVICATYDSCSLAHPRWLVLPAWTSSQFQSTVT